MCFARSSFSRAVSGCVKSSLTHLIVVIDLWPAAMRLIDIRSTPPALIENSVAVGASTVSIPNTLDRTPARPSGATVRVINGVVWCAWRRRDGRTSNLWRVANATAHFTAMDPGYCFQPSHPLSNHPHPLVSVYVSADAFV
ncbi:hypothetical protein NPIL_140621 [Nephila pilipes]|uniref:Uncharacterized protein n=1 Tax=Nephila pilipes TaxID=299642 RepID=A0A8X6MZT2_NEPPI|nr:hypothetical protein NPIL_140621 [Nephila pilipes]